MIESAMKLPSGMAEASSLVIVKVCVGYVFSEYSAGSLDSLIHSSKCRHQKFGVTALDCFWCRHS